MQWPVLECLPPSLPIQTVETLVIFPQSLGPRANATFSREPSLLVPVAAVPSLTELSEAPLGGSHSLWSCRGRQGSAGCNVDNPWGGVCVPVTLWPM